MKTRIYTISLLTLALLVSCQNREEAPAIDKTFKLIAVQDNGADSKTVISGERSVYWEPAEEIKVFRADGTGYLFKSANTEPAASAVFSGELTVDDVAPGEELWAMYPFSDGATFDGEAITTVLPSNQVARPESFARNMNLSVARTTGNKLQFYNVGGGVRFSVTQEGIGKVIFEGLNGEILSGKMTIGFEEGVPVVKEVSGGSMFITLTPPDGETFQTGKWYYMVAIPGALEQGYKLRFYKGEDYAKKVSETPVTIKRGVFGSVAEADKGNEYEPTSTSFPETEEEIEKSLDVAESIASISQGIIENVKESSGSGDIDAKSVAEELRKLEGVESAIPTESGNTVIVKQTDGVYVNVVLNSFLDDLREEALGTKSVVSISDNNTPNLFSLDERMTTPREKKALILMPVYDEAMDYFRDYNLLYGKSVYDILLTEFSKCGYQIIKYLNAEASLELFYGDNLDNYDIVYIHTHGMYDAVLTNGQGPYTAWLTGSLAEKDKGKRFFSNKSLCLGAREGELYYWITSDAIKKDSPSFNNTFFMAHACYSARNDDMKQYLIDHGVAAYCGFTDVASKGSSCEVVRSMFTALASGMSLEAAEVWTRKNTHNMFGYYCAYDLGVFRILSNVDRYDYYLFNPIPYNLESTVSGNQVYFTWKQNESDGDYRHSVVIDDTGTCYYADTAKEYTLSSLEPGTYHWYVRSDLMMNEEVVGSYRSDTKTFTVSPAKISVSPRTVQFGKTVVGQSALYAIAITNNGSAPIEFKSVTSSDSVFSTDFSQWSSKTLAAGASCTLKVYFKPSAARSYSASISIKTNAGNAPDVSLPVSGTGIQPKYNTPKAVDLGLSVKWASWNVGADAPEGFGYYFAWGETEPKGNYNWSTYKWCNGTSDDLTKYITDGAHGSDDNKSVLEEADDVAHVKLGGNWRTPTYAEWQELMDKDNCYWVWTSRNGVLGNLVTSNKNGNSIFLPAAGYWYSTVLYYEGSAGSYWSSSLRSNVSRDATCLIFKSDNMYRADVWRCYGSSVRPVKD